MCVVYFLTATENRAKQKESIALIANMASQIVTAVQVLGFFDRLLVMWPRASLIASRFHCPLRLSRFSICFSVSMAEVMRSWLKSWSIVSPPGRPSSLVSDVVAGQPVSQETESV